MEITEIPTVNMSETLVSPGCSVFKKTSNGFNHSTNLLPNIVHTLISSPPRQYPHSPTHTYLIFNGSIPHTQTFVRFYLLIEYPSRFGCVGFGGKRDHRLEENCEQKNQDAENDNRINAKHGAPAHSRIANGGGQRNSSIELLRIIAMFMILMYHFITQNGFPINKLPLAMEIFPDSSWLVAARSASSSSFPSLLGSSSTRNRPSNPT